MLHGAVCEVPARLHGKGSGRNRAFGTWWGLKAEGMRRPILENEAVWTKAQEHAWVRPTWEA